MSEQSETPIQQIKSMAPVFAIGVAWMVVVAGVVFTIDAVGLMPANPGARTAIEIAPAFAFLVAMIKAPELVEAVSTHD